MKEIMIQNEFGVCVHDGFAEWLSIHALGEIIDPNPVHNSVPIDIFAVALTGVINE